MTRNTISTTEIDESIASNRRSGLEPLVVGPVVSAARDKVLFEDSLLDSSVAQRKRRTWSTLLSFVLQLFLIGLLLLLPLWFTDVLPKQQLLVFLEAPPPPPPPPPPAASTPPTPKVVKVTSNIANGRLRAPSRIPAKVQVIKEDDRWCDRWRAWGDPGRSVGRGDRRNHQCQFEPCSRPYLVQASACSATQTHFTRCDPRSAHLQD